MGRASSGDSAVGRELVLREVLLEAEEDEVVDEAVVTVVALLPSQLSSRSSVTTPLSHIS